MEVKAPRLTVSLIVPVLNHEPRLTDVLDEIRALPGELEREVLIVYDVTRPELLDEIRSEQSGLEERYGARCVTRTAERGFGSALRAGFEASRGDVMIPIMGDCSDDIGAIPRMVARIAGGADIAVGSRYMPGGAIVGDTPKQQISRLYSRIMRSVSAIDCDDVSNSFRAYSRRVWESIPNESNSFDISVEMTVKAAAQRYRIEQVPAVWTNREAGRSSFRMLKELPNYTRWLSYGIRRAPRRSLLIAVLIGAVSLVLMTGWLLGLARGRRNE
ncbi:MAG TPA: glycosyltransferase family 2 protein [Dehalococcoidia bacterium]|nr:glycosyltransferase family 2 protein [Dehalococcoidia bacterium]